MKQNIKDIIFRIAIGILLALIIVAFVVIEVEVQHNWDIYEEQVFVELQSSLD